MYTNLLLIEQITKINTFINDIVWGWPTLIALVGFGIYITTRTKFFAITKLGYVLKNTLFKMFEKGKGSGEGEVTAFQAVSTALAATVGTGNIAGVATAIASGGPGAIFWMWLSAIFGMTTKFSEVVLSIKYREETEDGRFVGGPMYYIRNGLKQPWLAFMFAFFGAFASFGIGCMVQANSIVESLTIAFKLDTGAAKIIGIVILISAALVIIGGLKRIASITELFVPFMAAFYIIGGLVVIIFNYAKIPEAFGLIFSNAFTGKAAMGGALGTMIKYGVARGVFTNEAGLGSAPIAHAAATTDHPARQGLWGIFEVFVDTIVICTITALAILTTGVWETGKTGAELTMAAFQSVMPFGNQFLAIGLFLFAFSTILGWEYYGERCFEYLFGSSKFTITFYRAVYVGLIYVGSIGSLELLWDLADTLNALMIIPNLIALIFLSKEVVSIAQDFLTKEGVIEKTKIN